MSTRRSKLLIAHEDIDVIGDISSPLVSEGFEVGWTTSGQMVLKILERNTFDVVVVSASLQCGVETKVFEELQHRYPQLPLVLLADDDLGRGLATTEVFAYLVKPFDAYKISALSHVAIDRGGGAWTHAS
jgi:DNA-binding NtrC family response regulator